MDETFHEAATALASLASKLGELDADELEWVTKINQALFLGQHCASQMELLMAGDNPSAKIIPIKDR